MTEFSNDIMNLKKALEEAEKANHKKNDFLNRMSHEIRTPLNAIIGLSYLSKENEAMPAKVYENLDKIEQSAHFLLSFVNDILSLSDLETGKIALEYDAVENEAYFAELEQKIRKLTDAKQIHVTFSVLNEMDKYYVFDGKKLSKAIMHVVESAVKSTPSGGTIAIEAEVLSQDDRKAVLQFTISDNGLGIDENLLPVVFEPFEHIYGESRTLYNGSGLELAITKNIVELMNGSIDVQSKKGEGATFTITVEVMLERRSKLRPKEERNKAASYDFTGKRVLIVEDSDINIEIAKNILLHKNFEVEVALNGEEAVHAFDSHGAGYYDVILMDIRMPVMDGLEATKVIRGMENRPDGRNIPIVAMTANAFEEDVKKSLEAGMNGHLSKPIDIKKMYALLDMLLSEEE
ncbi:MAG: response regulator [Roseburia sp.]|nr:response regulator [Roseburia sp.]